MKRLFIDTHSEKVTVAIVTEDKTYIKEQVSDRSHSEVVVPLLDSLLEEAKMNLKELDEIIVVNGPGSFTGVRIGVTIAKTIAYSLNIPIKTLTSLEMFGESSTSNFDVVTVLDSKGVYSARRVDGEYTDFMYQRKADFEEYVAKNGFNVLEERELNIERILKYMETKEVTNPHKVNPIYIKEIDALK